MASTLCIATALILINLFGKSSVNVEPDQNFVDAYCEGECSICDSRQMQQFKQMAIEEGIRVDPHYWDYITKNTITISMEDLKEQYPKHYNSIVESMLEEGLDPYGFSAVTTSFVDIYDLPDDSVDNGDTCLPRKHKWGLYLCHPSINIDTQLFEQRI